MNEIIQKLHDDRVELTNKLKDINNAISALEKVCDHDYVYSWHDSHYDYFRCKKCGKEIK